MKLGLITNEATNPRSRVSRQCLLLAAALLPIAAAACTTTSDPPRTGPPADAAPDQTSPPPPPEDAGADGSKDAAPNDASLPPTDAPTGDAGDAAAQPSVIVTGAYADSLITDGTNIYWRSSFLDDAGANFSVILAKCPLAGGCPAGGDVLATTSALLVFAGEHEVALAADKVIAPVGGSLMACATGGCGGVLSTITTTPGYITSVTASGTQLYFGETGAVGSRFMESCDVASCATPTKLGATTGAPGDPSVSGSTLTFAGRDLFVTPTSGFPDGGATLLASTTGLTGMGMWNDGTDVYFGIGGLLETNDAGDSYTQNGTGYVARCALAGCSGKPTVIASAESNVGGVVVDGTDVYWPVMGPLDANGLPTAEGRIETCSKTDGCATVKTFVRGGNPARIAVDAAYVYWADQNARTISRMARR